MRGGRLNLTYTYAAGANNGQISSMTDGAANQTVTYGYDSLKRLVSASGAGGTAWSQMYGYDGFGSLTAKNGTTAWNRNVDANTNRVIGYCYDSNGNLLAPFGCQQFTTQQPCAYDIQNRLTGSGPGGGNSVYLYNAQNKRVAVIDSAGNETVYFYGVASISDEESIKNDPWQGAARKTEMSDKIERDPSFVSWMLQLVIAYSAPTIALMVTWPNLPDTTFNQILEYLFVLGAATALALLISTVAKDSPAEGILVCIIPAALELTATAWGLFSEGLAPTVHALFFSPGPGQGEGSWGVVLITQPVCGCCWYSAVMCWRRRVKQREAGESRV